MADPHHASDAHDDYVRGSQEISEQVSTFHLFMNMAKYGSLAIAAALAFLVIWFMPHGSFFGGLITAVVMMVGGVWFLRPKSSH
ncbi:aa3-type cytochrome c oxidase subunit IV [Brevundimonas lenta]|uniref:Cytochrome c oxidase subunit IV bacterial aa3 type domain-containing protein n=1 Tax=Brevundimonas lenta TaxID=424796 RepID=A0A7W6JG98_9CAUL|nr:aa3-type cytochrome c oxidase subunit IV [Brevundimonas lenta]MBB4083551.1 hypothetical protein [Brevundimonas lenta]